MGKKIIKKKGGGPYTRVAEFMECPKSEVLEQWIGCRSIGVFVQCCVGKRGLPVGALPKTEK
jgi:hypothetical protein